VSGRLIAHRYAKALVEIAIEQGKLEAIQQELVAVDTLVRTNPDLQRLTAYPLLAPVDRANAFEAILVAAKASVIVQKFFRVVTISARLYLIHDIIDVFRELVDQHQGVVVARVTTAHPLSEPQSATLVAALTERTRRTIRMHCKQDPALLGGLKVQLGSMIYDASLQGRLQHLKAQLLSA